MPAAALDISRPRYYAHQLVWDVGSLAWVAMTQPVAGGASDATAANQVTGNASLSSIDGKLPALVSSRVPVDGSGVTQPVSVASLPALAAGSAVIGHVIVDTAPSTAVTNANLDAALSTLATAAKQPTLVSGRTPVDPSGVTSPVSIATAPVLVAGSAVIGKVGIDQTTPGTTNAVQANAGTNLNTSLLALEAGGNLASIKARTDNIPPVGQAVAGASTPVVLPAAQVTTLTPPAAITGFALEAGHLATIDTNNAPFTAAAAGGYVRQDSTATIAKESGGNLATLANNLLVAQDSVARAQQLAGYIYDVQQFPSGFVSCEPHFLGQ